MNLPNPSDRPPEPPPPPPEPTNEVARQGEVPTQTVIEGPPSHVIWRDEGPEFVHPDGYEDDAVEPLPEGFWDVPMKADPVARTFAPDLDAARAVKRAEIGARMAQAFLAGYPASIGDLAGERLQVRDEQDRTNWLTSQAAYSAQVAAGNGAQTGATFRTESNRTVTLTYLDGLHELLRMAGWGATIFAVSWSLKDEAARTDDAAAILAIDVEKAGWPS